MSQEHFVSIAKRIYDESGMPEQAAAITSEFDAFFYSGAQRQHQLETIRHLATYGDLILTITADVGAGKSALLSEAAAQLDEELHVVFVAASLDMSFASLVNDIAEQSSIFSPSAEQPDAVLQRCREAYERLYSSHGKRTFLIIDDADRLDGEDLVGLIESLALMGADSPLTLLCASARKLESLEKYYDKDSFYQLSLAKLKRHEIGEYVEQGLASVGYRETLTLSDAKLDALLVRSHGLPASIETYMGSVIFTGDDSYTETVSDVKPTKVPVAVLGVIVMVLLGSFVFVAHQHSLFAGAFDGISGPDQGLENFEAKKQRIAMLDKALKQSEKFEAEAEAEVLNFGQEPVSASSDKVVQHNADSEQAEETSESNAKERLNVSSSESLDIEPVKVALAEPVEEKRRLPAELKKNVAELVTEPAALDKTEKERTESLSLANKGLVASPVERPSNLPKSPATDTGVASASPETSVMKDGSSGSAHYREPRWVARQSDAAHTFQVLGSYNESTAKTFVERNPDIGLYYVRSTYKGKPWYVVLYGMYPDAAAARAARPKLPKKVALEKPWIRCFSGLK